MSWTWAWHEPRAAAVRPVPRIRGERCKSRTPELTIGVAVVWHTSYLRCAPRHQYHFFQIQSLFTRRRMDHNCELKTIDAFHLFYIQISAAKQPSASDTLQLNIRFCKNTAGRRHLTYSKQWVARTINTIQLPTHGTQNIQPLFSCHLASYIVKYRLLMFCNHGDHYSWKRTFAKIAVSQANQSEPAYSCFHCSYWRHY